MKISQSSTQINHHITDNIILSTKNCVNMSDLFAHIDLSIHISLVLSATHANITFIIPIHDTTRTIVAINVKSKLIVVAES
jgi:hypothetical protein